MESDGGARCCAQSAASCLARGERGGTVAGAGPCRARRLPGSRTLALACLALAAACGPAPKAPEAPPADGGWREFSGTWTASGTRHVLRLDGDRRSSIGDFSGALLLAGPARPAVGFRAEAIVFNDSATGAIGRAVWTDERGDRIFSELRGEGTATGNKVAGTFIGGTGRYAGATGTYEFSWRFVLEGEGGSEQGQSEGLRGRIRVGSPQPAAGAGGTRP